MRYLETLENVRKRIKYELITDKDRFRKLASSPFFHDRDIINDDVVGVHMLRANVTLNKPILLARQY